MAARLGRLRRAAFLRLLRWAQDTAPIREDALADVGLAWPLLRRLLLELGGRLVHSGVIAEPADVFWLRYQELRSAVEFGLAAPGARAAVAISGADRPARVLAGPRDFSTMVPGEVLVARITTPAWTPLFAIASAVVTDVGGPLSHGSIVDGDAGIPAVLGTGVATQRLATGQQVTVDGDAGTVTIERP